MYILIVNAQPLGRNLAQVLVNRGHEVAYVDEKEEFCQRIATDLGCLVILLSLHVVHERPAFVFVTFIPRVTACRRTMSSLFMCPSVVCHSFRVLLVQAESTWFAVCKK